jgi:medium-chain acyl-[acyl-carrier-protein] hydrolase
MRPAALRLLCFPYAGGGASLYHPWVDALGPELDVVPVQLPGREERMREPRFTRMEDLMAPLARAVAPALDRPFALFGHSMGAVVAYELARHLHAAGTGPVHLIVSACRPPARIRDGKEIWNLPKAEFLAELRLLGGTPEEVLDSELMEVFAPLLRADLQLHGSYRPLPGEPLACPVTAFWGSCDPRTRAVPIEEWRSVTTGPFGAVGFEGGHFFVRERRSEVIARVRAIVAERPGTRGVSGQADQSRADRSEGLDGCWSS